MHFSFEVRRLEDIGVLGANMNYAFDPDAITFLSFHNSIGGRLLVARISYDLSRLPEEPLHYCITDEASGQDPEIISIYAHRSLEHLVRTAKGLLCIYTGRANKRKVVVNKKVSVSLRVDGDLRCAFDKAANATGESPAVVLRQLMRYFIGKGPDPSTFG